MTILVAIKDHLNDCVYMGCDSQMTKQSQIINGENKMFKTKGNDDCIIGCTGSCNILQHLRNNKIFHPKELKRLKKEKKEYNSDFFINSFLPRYKDLVYNINNKPDIISLICAKNKIFTIESDFTVIEHSTDFYTTGSGERFAMGFLTAIDKYNPEMSIIDKIINTIKESCKVDTYCKPPIYIMNTSNPDDIIKIE